EQAGDGGRERVRIARRTGETVLAGSEDLAERGPLAGHEPPPGGGGLPHLVRNDHRRLRAGAEDAEDHARRRELRGERRERHLVAPADARAPPTGERLRAYALGTAADHLDVGAVTQPGGRA